jgi:hypothetical protein
LDTSTLCRSAAAWLRTDKAKLFKELRAFFNLTKTAADSKRRRLPSVFRIFPGNDFAQLSKLLQNKECQK